MKLYFHPLSTYSQKAVIGFLEKGVSFEPNIVDLMSPEGKEAYRKVYPLGKMPFLVRDDGWKIPESSIILEFLDSHSPGGTKLIPADPEKARQTRFFDRMADLYMNEPISTLFFEGFRPGSHTKDQIEKAKFTASTAYEMFDKHLAGKKYVMGDQFTMPDCAMAPVLFYGREIFPFNQHANLSAYWNRCCERPSVKKVQADATPYYEGFKKMKKG